MFYNNWIIMVMKLKKNHDHLIKMNSVFMVKNKFAQEIKIASLSLRYHQSNPSLKQRGGGVKVNNISIPLHRNMLIR